MPIRANAQIIAELREAIEKIDGSSRRSRKALAFGVPEIDNRLPNGGLAYSAIHEIAGGGEDVVHGAISALFTAGIAARTQGPILWCLTRTDLFMPGLAQVGLKPGRVIFVECKDETAIAESFEEVLRFGGTGAAVAELVRLPMDMSRRFQLAAEKTGSMGLIIRRWRRQSQATDYGNPTAAATRWRVSAMPSEPLPVQGVGRARWLLELMRQRAGESFDVEVNACDGRGHMSAVHNDWYGRRYDERRTQGRTHG
ncbi:ImuA family protein [Pararhizobium sp. O133]|uniref:ImuA family protein n=1 Tax=Pararhizobium sp. O133 TaxID=3449278 RepID=UPI003F68427A